MPSVPISEIADLVSGRYDGPRDLAIRGVATLSDAQPDQLSFLGNPKYAAQLVTTKAGALLVPKSAPGEDVRFIRVDDVYFAMARILDRWFGERTAPSGISPLASIASTVHIGANARIAPFVAIGENVTIGD